MTYPPVLQGKGVVSVQLSGRIPKASIKRCQPEAMERAAPSSKVISGKDFTVIE
jgi:hypothetical protein